MEIYRNKNVEVIMRYDIMAKKTYGDIFYKEKPIGKVVDDSFLIDYSFLSNLGIKKIEEVEEITQSCEELKFEIEDYSRMWRERGD